MPAFKRTSITVEADLFAASQRRASALGYPSFSSYVAYLFAKDVKEHPPHITVRDESGTHYWETPPSQI
jgi:hypothetical protein